MKARLTPGSDADLALLGRSIKRRVHRGAGVERGQGEMGSTPTVVVERLTGVVSGRVFILTSDSSGTSRSQNTRYGEAVTARRTTPGKAPDARLNVVPWLDPSRLIVEDVSHRVQRTDPATSS
jgi:hypothetical protein